MHINTQLPLRSDLPRHWLIVIEPLEGFYSPAISDTSNEALTSYSAVIWNNPVWIRKDCQTSDRIYIFRKSYGGTADLAHAGITFGGLDCDVGASRTDPRLVQTFVTRKKFNYTFYFKSWTDRGNIVAASRKSWTDAIFVQFRPVWGRFWGEKKLKTPSIFWLCNTDIRRALISAFKLYHQRRICRPRLTINAISRWTRKTWLYVFRVLADLSWKCN